MKITSFNPLIVTKDAQAAVKLFEDLGFRQEHNIQATQNNGNEINTFCLENADGFHIDISQAPVSQDLSLIRMNVDDFDEAYELLKARGFTNPRGGQTVDTRTNKSCMMPSPSGFAFDLCQHIKEDTTK